MEPAPSTELGPNDMLLPRIEPYGRFMLDERETSALEESEPLVPSKFDIKPDTIELTPFKSLPTLTIPLIPVCMADEATDEPIESAKELRTSRFCKQFPFRPINFN